jgi:pyruvate dehydrogenase E1 component
MYRFSAGETPAKPGRKAHLFGSGAIMTEVLRAQALLQAFGVAADVWSVTSYNELCREAQHVERTNPGRAPRRGRADRPWVEQLLAGRAASSSRPATT